jgi:hypothetical protein
VTGLYSAQQLRLLLLEFLRRKDARVTQTGKFHEFVGNRATGGSGLPLRSLSAAYECRMSAEPRFNDWSGTFGDVTLSQLCTHTQDVKVSVSCAFAFSQAEPRDVLDSDAERIARPSDPVGGGPIFIILYSKCKRLITSDVTRNSVQCVGDT